MSDATIEELLAHRAWLAELVRGLVRDSGTADDVVQEAWVRALVHPPGERRGLRGWLATVARNLVTDERRRRAREERRDRLGASERHVTDTADVVARVESEREVARLVLELPEPYRSTLLLRYWRGLSAAAIARESCVAAGTVRSRLSRGHRMLRERLDEKHEGRRRAWILALLPLLESKPAGGSTAMSIAGKVAAVVVLVVAAGVGTSMLMADPAPPIPTIEEQAPTAVAATVPPAEPEAKEEEPAKPTGPEGDPLDNSVNLSCSDTRLSDALRFLGEVHDLKFDLADVPADTLISVSAKNITIREAIDLLTKLGGCRWEQGADRVIVVRRDPEATVTKPERKPGPRTASEIPEPAAPDPVYPADPPVIDLAPADMAVPLPVRVANEAIEIAIDRNGRWSLRARPDGRYETPPTEYLVWLRLSDVFAASPVEDRPLLVRVDRRTAVGHVRSLYRVLEGLGRPVGEVWFAAQGLEDGTCGLRGFDAGRPPKELRARVRLETRETSSATLDADDLYDALHPLLSSADAGPRTIGFAFCGPLAEFGGVIAVLNEATRFGCSIHWPGSSPLRGPATAMPGRFGVISSVTGTGAPPKLRPGVALARRPAPEPIQAKQARFPFNGRGGHRNLRANGGSAKTKSAGDWGLHWLAAVQEPDGSWRSDAHKVATTSVALLAFLGSGETSTRGNYKANVGKGRDWLLARRGSDGAFGEDALGHAAATLVLVESYGQSIGDPALRGPAQQAVDRLQEMPANLASIHVLAIARLAGLRIDVERHTIAVRTLGDSSPLELAVGTFDRFLIGDTPDIPKVGPELLRHAPSAGGDGGMLLWLAGTDAMLRIGGGGWKEWNQALLETLLPRQRKGRAEVGSFDPVGPVATEGGRVVSTALAVLCFESYFRYGEFRAFR